MMYVPYLVDYSDSTTKMGSQKCNDLGRIEYGMI